jgi:glycosyltransferase involved in cell wall biosynthesis
MALRIGVIGNISLDSKADGIAAYIRTFFKYAKSMEFVYWGGRQGGERELGDNVVSCHPLGSTNKAISHLPHRLAIQLSLWQRKLEINNQVDLLFVHNSEWVVPLVFSHQRTPPILLVMHGWNPVTIARTRGWLSYSWLRICDALAVKAAAKVIMVSQEGFRGFSRRYPSSKEKLIHIPTFIDDDLVSAPSKLDARRPLNILGAPVLLCVSRLEPEKQVNKAIEALAVIRRSLPKATLLIVGDGTETAKLRALVKSLALNGAVRFEGMVPHNQIGAYLSAADFFLLLSRWEGTSIALLEAQAMGVPAIVTDIADHRAIITDNVNGTVVAPDRIVEETAAFILRTSKMGALKPAIIRNTATRYLASNVVPRITALMDQLTKSIRRQDS